MKKIILILFIGFSNILVAQSSLAKIEYSYAEEAFTGKDYKKVLEHIEETKSLLGSTNARIMYLEIRSLEKSFSSDKNTLEDYIIYKKLNDLTSSYVSNFENDVPIGKLKFVYDIQKKYKIYTIEIDNLIRGEKDAEEKKYDSAINYYSIPCDAGNAEACKNIAYMYEYKKEYSLIQKFLEKAINLGNIEAKASNGYNLFYGLNEYSKNKELGLQLMEQAYDEGFKSVTPRLAYAFLGIDDVKSKKLYYEALKLKMKGSALSLFVHFDDFDKEIVKIATEENLQFLKEEPKNGYQHLIRCIILVHYEKHPEAYISLKKSCELNHAESCSFLSQILSDKKFVLFGQKKDKKKAKEYINKACSLDPAYCN